MDFNYNLINNVSEIITTTTSQQNGVTHSYASTMDINSNYQTLNPNPSYSYNKNIPQHVTTGQNVNVTQSMISGSNSLSRVIVDQNLPVYEDPSITEHDKFISVGPDYVPNATYTENTMLQVPSHHTPTSANNPFIGAHNFEQNQNYLFDAQETSQPSYQISNIDEIIPSANLSHSSLSSQNSSALLQNSHSNSAFSFADILIDQSASSNGFSDFEVLSSCLQIAQGGQISGSETSVNPEIPLNENEITDTLYSALHQHTHVAANEDCITSEEVSATQKPGKRDQRSTLLVSGGEGRKRRKLKQLVVWDDTTSLPEEINLPLPSYCDCEKIEVDLNAKTVAQSYIKNDKTLILHHVGRVVINDIELCSFVRNNTAFVSKYQLQDTGIFDLKAPKLFSTCGRSFPSFVDRLLVEEREYMKQKGFMPNPCSKLMLFSVGFVRWILDYLTREEGDTEQTVVYERYLGHNCSKYQNLKLFQTPKPLSLPHLKTFKILQSKKNDKIVQKQSKLLTTCMLKSSHSENFVLVEIGRLIFVDKVFAAFLINDERQVVYVNCFQIISYATGVTSKDFYSLVDAFNCKLISCPDGVMTHFNNLKQEIPKEFFNCKWIEYENFKQFCSFLFGKLDQYPCSRSYITQILKSKPKNVFGKDLKSSMDALTFPEKQQTHEPISGVTFPEGTRTTAQQSSDILSMAAASAHISPESVQTTSQKDKLSSNIQVSNPELLSALKSHSRVVQGIFTPISNLKTAKSQTEIKNSNPGKLQQLNSKTQHDSKKRSGIRKRIPKMYLPKELVKSQWSESTCGDSDHTATSKNLFVMKTSETQTVHDDLEDTETANIISYSRKKTSKIATNQSVNKTTEMKGQDVVKAQQLSENNEIILNSSNRIKNIEDAEPSDAIEMIGDEDLLNTSLDFDLSETRNESINETLPKNAKTISSNPNVTVISNDQGGEIFEFVPLFSLNDLVQKDGELFINPYSSFSTETKQTQKLLENKTYDIDQDQSMDIDKLPVQYKDSYDDSFGPLKKNGLNTKTLNQVIFGDEVSDIVLSPKKNGSPSRLITSIFDTPKTSPSLDRSGHRSPRLQSLYKKFNQLERDTTPDTSLHFFAEIASASEDMNGKDSQNSKSRNMSSGKSLKDISRASLFLQDLILSNGKISKDKSCLNIKLKKKLQALLEISGDESTRQSLKKLLKLCASLVSKIWMISVRQKHLLLLDGISDCNSDKSQETKTQTVSKEDNKSNIENRLAYGNESQTQTVNETDHIPKIKSTQPEFSSSDRQSDKKFTCIRSPKMCLNFDMNEFEDQVQVNALPPHGADGISGTQEKKTPCDTALEILNSIHPSKNTQNLVHNAKDTDYSIKQNCERQKLKNMEDIIDLCREESPEREPSENCHNNPSSSNACKKSSSVTVSTQCNGINFPVLVSNLSKPPLNFNRKGTVSDTAKTIVSGDSTEQCELGETTEGSGKRKRKRPVKFADEFPVKPVRRRKKRKTKINQSTPCQSMDETVSVANSNHRPSNELLVFIPSAYSVNGPVPDEETELIPASYYRNMYNNGKSVKELIAEKDRAKSKENPSNLSYSVIDSNNKQLEVSQPCREKSQLGNLVGEDRDSGETYEIFKSV